LADRAARAELRTLFDTVDEPTNSPRYNVAPGQLVATVRLDDDGQRHWRNARWGLIPSWAKDKKEGFKHINARSETAATKPSFRAAFKKRRCLIAADGFFEWEKRGKEKIPHHFRLHGGVSYAFAGLWETWHGEGSPVESCTVLTCAPNEIVQPYHDRMPVILPAEGYERWLNPTSDPADLQALLGPYPADRMESFVVDQVVNNARNDVPECVQPVEAAVSSRSLFG
jgi:putative SOS response-associated peptidase YedK